MLEQTEIELYATLDHDNLTSIDRLKQWIDWQLNRLELHRRWHYHHWGTKAQTSTDNVMICAKVARQRFNIVLSDPIPSTELSFAEEYDWFQRFLIECAKKAHADSVPDVSKEDDGISIAEDFTSATWGPHTFKFSGKQVACVRALWEARGKGAGTLSEKSIGNKISSSNGNFRLAHVFRARERKGGVRRRVKKSLKKQTGYHPAWGTMIVKAGKGIYKIVGHGSGTRITE